MENKKERETVEFKTKGGVTLVVKSYITGREANEIQSSYLKDANVRQNSATFNRPGHRVSRMHCSQRHRLPANPE